MATPSTRRPTRRPTRLARGLRALAAGAAVLALAAGCSGGGGEVEQAASPAPGKGAPISAGARYVALGDSYTAGYLTGPTDATSGGCLRATTNYPRQVAQALDLDLDDVSCGGATTESVAGEQTTATGEKVAPQIEAVSAATDLVTIGIGANDFNAFGGIVVNCVQAATTNPNGAPCTALVKTQGGDAALRSRVDDLRDRLVDVVRAVLERAPQARVVLVGYPEVFPASGSCEQLPLAKGDYELAHDTMKDITDALRRAARATGVEYLDVWTASKGHDICADDPWIAGVRPTRTDGYAWHPFPEEQELVADLLQEQLRGDGD
ncbi:SGNH/GDSL hydrolase family protein [Nocardioides sp.]|uniref:SGNH/GDSL hydrolase family protein n=1 Tax=Nocardioides sp. TaxID=35761 RepID=UPI003510E594